MRLFCLNKKKEGADMKEIIFWMAVTVLLSVIEAVTANLVTVWFAVGAFGAVIAAAAGATTPVQVTVSLYKGDNEIIKKQTLNLLDIK